jgi:Bacterial Ig domain
MVHARVRCWLVLVALVGLVVLASLLLACEDNWIGIHSIGSGTELAGAVDIQADMVEREVAFAKIEFAVDDRVIATTTPDVLSVKWNTTKVANGEHRLQVRGTQTNNKVIESQLVTVKVTNGQAREG